MQLKQSQDSLDKKREWEIKREYCGLRNKYLLHRECGRHSFYRWRKRDGFYCHMCRKSIPDYIVFQWKLLNE